MYHHNKFHSTVNDKQPIDDNNVTFTFYWTDVTFGRMTQLQAMAACKGALKLRDMPVVIAQRDTINVYHVLNVQLVPIFAALRKFGMDGASSR